MPAVLSRFLERFPAVGVEIHVEFPEPMFSGLLRNSLDVMCYINIPAVPGVTIETLCEEPLCVVVSPSHPLVSQRRVSAAELTTYPFIAPTSGSLRAVVESKLRAAGVIPRAEAEARHADAIKKLVERGAGYSMIIQSAVAEELNSGQLVELKLPGPPLRAELVAAYQSRAVISSVVRAFIDFVRAELLSRTPESHRKAPQTAQTRAVRTRGRKLQRVSGARTRSSRAGRRGSSS
jgi:DNA-binding transcriptional LysR family regulator